MDICKACIDFVHKLFIIQLSTFICVAQWASLALTKHGRGKVSMNAFANIHTTNLQKQEIAVVHSKLLCKIKSLSYLSSIVLTPKVFLSHILLLSVARRIIHNADIAKYPLLYCFHSSDVLCTHECLHQSSARDRVVMGHAVNQNKRGFKLSDINHFISHQWYSLHYMNTLQAWISTQSIMVAFRSMKTSCLSDDSFSIII